MIVGLGHPFRGDDNVGSYIAKRLIERKEDIQHQDIYFFDAEENLETMMEPVVALAPKHVIFIDACEMGLNGGEVRLLSIADTSYPFFTTHSIPLRVIAENLLPRTEVWVLAIQPKSTCFGDKLSRESDAAANYVSRFIMNVLENREIDS